MIQTNLLQHFRTKKNGTSSQLSTTTKNTKILDGAELKFETKMSNTKSPIKINNNNGKKRLRGIIFSELMKS